MNSSNITILGEVVARNMCEQLEALGWDFERLAQETGLTWGQVVRWRGDASDMTMNELSAIADGLGVSPAELAVTA